MATIYNCKVHGRVSASDTYEAESGGRGHTHCWQPVMCELETDPYAPQNGDVAADALREGDSDRALAMIAANEPDKVKRIAKSISTRYVHYCGDPTCKGGCND